MKQRRPLGILPKNINEIFKMCGGRATYNKRRQMLAAKRRLELAKMLSQIPLRRGWKAELARRLNVHRGTIARDIQVLAREWRRAVEATADEGGMKSRRRAKGQTDA